MLSSVAIQRLIFLFVAGLLLFLSVSLYQRMQQLGYSYELIDRSNEIQLNLEKVFSATKEAETSQRGYLLTRDPIFLKPYKESQNKLDSLLQTVKASIPFNQKQQLHLLTLQYLIKRRLARTDFTLNNIDSIAAVPGLLEQRLLQGKNVMENIRHQVDTMLEEENRQLEESKKLKQEYINLTPKSLLFLSLFSLLVLFAAYFRLNHQLKVRNHFAGQLSQKNEELNIKNKELETTNEELQSFNYVASHDLREPVRKIKTFVSRIQKEDCTSDDRNKYIERINVITSHMQHLLDDLFAYSRTSMEERVIEKVDLNKVITQIEESIVGSMEDNKVEIITRSLPIVDGVSFQLRQLFENLILNSIKYKRDGVKSIIEIYSEVVSKSELPASFHSTYSSFFKISVKDNGIGFEQQYGEKIFNLFQRLHSRKDLTGTGAGLAICKKVVQNHEGIITAESQPNKGATFHIFLPYRATALTSDKKMEILSAM